jgi:hypothetical protein
VSFRSTRIVFSGAIFEDVQGEEIFEKYSGPAIDSIREGF